MAVGNIFGGHVDVLLERQLATPELRPFVGEALETRIGPRLHCRVPGLAGAMHAEKRRGETVFDWLVEIIREHGPGGAEQEDRVELILD